MKISLKNIEEEAVLDRDSGLKTLLSSDTILAMVEVVRVAGEFIQATYPDMSHIQQYTKLVASLKPLHRGRERKR